MPLPEFELHRAVYDDAFDAWQDLASDDSPRRRRAYVRAALAGIEALTYILKQDALRRGTARPGIYSAAELAVLREEAYSLNSKGKAYATAKFVPVPDNFRFAVDMLMHGILPGFKLHVGVAEWECLRRAVAVRNRIVHPKATTDFAVADSDLSDVHTAFLWVNHSTVSSLVRAVEVLYQETGAAPAPELGANSATVAADGRTSRP